MTVPVRTPIPGDLTFRVVRQLLRLKLMLSWRAYRANKYKALSAILYLFLFIPVGLVGFGVYYVITANPSVLFWVARDGLLLLYAIWITAPLLGFQMNESYDLTKLFTYPIGYWQILLGSIIGSMIDQPVILMAPPLIALWLGCATTGVLPAAETALLLLLFVCHAIAISQAIGIVLIGFLRSRRFRDITIVVFPLIGLTYYVGQQALVRQVASIGAAEFLNAPLWTIAAWIPPGYAANGLAAAINGNTIAWAGWCLTLVASTAAAIAVAAAALKRLYTGEGYAIGGASRRADVDPRHSGTALPIAPRSLLLRWAPDDIATMAAKELTYLRRDPQYKAVLVQMLYTVVASAAPFIVPILQRGQVPYAGSLFGVGTFVGIMCAILLATSPLVFNLFGGEGAAVTVLFSFPTPRRRIFLAKNLAHAVTLILFYILSMTVAAALTRQWSTLPIALIAVIIGLPIVLAAGNLISVRLPHRLIVRGQRWQRGGVSAASNNAGCAFGFFYLLAFAATAVMTIPIAAAAIIPAITANPPLWYIVGFLLAACYSASLYFGLLGVAEGWLLCREPEIAAAVVPPE